MSSPPRWPLHPRPNPLESLSSWLERLAGLYGVSVAELLTGTLEVDEAPGPAVLDVDPPAVLLSRLAERTGVPLDQLRMLTLAGWQPWLFDTVWPPQQGGQEIFDTYVRANSVLLPPGQARPRRVDHHRVWRGVWRTDPPLQRACPICATDPNRGRAWVWQFPLVSGCGEHGCRLEPTATVELARLRGKRMTPIPVAEPLATMDRYTYRALTAGEVTLPGRTVHLGVWLRLLRSLLDEVSLAPSTLSPGSRTTLHRVWQVIGRPDRGGLTLWRPYEHLDWEYQQAMLHAAATALQLAADGQITARGRLGPALTPSPLHPHPRVYDGDQPHGAAHHWNTILTRIAPEIPAARTDATTAMRLLITLSFAHRPLPSVDRARWTLLEAGIPAEFLPHPRATHRAAPCPPGISA